MFQHLLIVPLTISEPEGNPNPRPDEINVLADEGHMRLFETMRHSPQLLEATVVQCRDNTVISYASVVPSLLQANMNAENEAHLRTSEGWPVGNAERILYRSVSYSPSAVIAYPSEWPQPECMRGRDGNVTQMCYMAARLSHLTPRALRDELTNYWDSSRLVGADERMSHA